MTTELPYREDLAPLCPVDFSTMVRTTQDEPPVFTCPAKGCELQWRRRDGYFYSAFKDLSSRSSTVEFLKMGMIVEHGYFYLAEIAGTRKTWLCSVKDCVNSLVEE